MDLCLHYKFILDRRCQFLSQILVICGTFWFSAFIGRKLHLRLIECSEVLTARLLLVKERVVSGFNASKAVILMSRTSMTVKNRKFSKIPNWRHYLLKTRAKRKKNCRNHWEWLKKPFRIAWKSWEWFISKEIGFGTSWSREMSILQHVNGRSNVAKPVKTYLETLKLRTLQTLLLPTTIRFDQWHTAWLIRISAVMKKSKNGSIRGSPQKTNHFSRW